MARAPIERSRSVREGRYGGSTEARSPRALKARVRSMDLILSFTQKANIIGFVWSNQGHLLN